MTRSIQSFNKFILVFGLEFNYTKQKKKGQEVEILGDLLKHSANSVASKNLQKVHRID